MPTRKKPSQHGGFRPGAGRKPARGEIAGTTIALRVTPAERATYQAAADAAHLPLGAWIRAACDLALKRSAKRPGT